MTDELVLYTNPMSRGRIVRWMLEEIGCPYRTEFLDYGTTMKAPHYISVNPMGKVPAIRHGDTVVTEAAAICAYLAEAFPEAGLAPPHMESNAATDNATPVMYVPSAPVKRNSCGRSRVGESKMPAAIA